MRENHMRVRDCPLSGKFETLCVTFAKINSIGTPEPLWRKIGYSCSNEECPADCPNECPVYLQEEY